MRAGLSATTGGGSAAPLDPDWGRSFASVGVQPLCQPQCPESPANTDILAQLPRSMPKRQESAGAAALRG